MIRSPRTLGLPPRFPGSKVMRVRKASSGGEAGVASAEALPALPPDAPPAPAAAAEVRLRVRTAGSGALGEQTCRLARDGRLLGVERPGAHDRREPAPSPPGGAGG